MGADPAHDPAAPGGGGAVALTTAAAPPAGKGEGKARLFTGAPSTSPIDIAAHSAP